MSERRTFSGTGKIMLGLADNTEPLYWLGNASSAVISIEADRIEQANYFALGGGTYNSRSRAGTGTVSITALELTNVMQRAGLLAAVTEETSAAISDELQPVGPGAYSAFDKMVDIGVAITVAEGVDAWADATDYSAGDWVSSGGNYYQADSSGTSSGTGPGDDTGVTWTDKGAAPTVPSPSDFTVDAGGALLAEDYTWPAGAPLKFSYTAKARTLAAAFKTGAVEWRCRFVGFNEAESDVPVVVDIFKVKFDPSDLELITEEFGEFNLEGALSIDTDRTAANQSGFYEVQYGSTGGIV